MESILSNFIKTFYFELVKRNDNNLRRLVGHLRSVNINHFSTNGVGVSIGDVWQFIERFRC